MNVIARYAGPLREQPISVELHNTLYATPRGPVDGLADPASRQAFLHDIGPRMALDSQLPEPRPDAHELLELRRVIRSALHASIDHKPHDPGELDALNRFAARAPTSIKAEPAKNSREAPVAGFDYHRASPEDIILAAFAADTINLITTPHRAEIRACGAPGCVLIYLKNDPRQRWCSNACGNRARQARHYQRSQDGLYRRGRYDSGR